MTPNSYEYQQERRSEALKAQQVAKAQENQKRANGARFKRRDSKTIVLS